MGELRKVYCTLANRVGRFVWRRKLKSHLHSELVAAQGSWIQPRGTRRIPQGDQRSNSSSEVSKVVAQTQRRLMRVQSHIEAVIAFVFTCRFRLLSLREEGRHRGRRRAAWFAGKEDRADFAPTATAWLTFRNGIAADDTPSCST